MNTEGPVILSRRSAAKDLTSVIRFSLKRKPYDACGVPRSAPDDTHRPAASSLGYRSFRTVFLDEQELRRFRADHRVIGELSLHDG